MDAREKIRLLEITIADQIDQVKDSLDRLQESLKTRDLLEMDGESGEFYSHYIELEAIHGIIDALFYRILRSSNK